LVVIAFAERFGERGAKVAWCGWADQVPRLAQKATFRRRASTHCPDEL